MEFTSNENKGGRKRRFGWGGKVIRVELFIVLVGSALLLAAVSLFLGFSDTGRTETKQIDTTKYQAVFLNIGQVYFGKISSVNDKYLVLNDVFYVNCNTGTNGNSTCQQNGNNTYTLYKLGVNELHAPQDKMVINQSQIAYWENLKDSGKVVQAILQYKKNPNAGTNSQVNSGSSNPSNSTNNSTSGTGQ